jgi:GNAT superfamily N-acetyltransferase
MNADDPLVAEFLEAMVRSIEPLYGRIDVPGMPSGRPEDFAPPGGAFLVGFDADGRAVCGGGVKRLGDGICEIKRMYVVPEARGRGLARALLVALEDAGRALGYERARLDTGPRQPEALHLYRSAGYREIPDYNGNVAASYWGEKSLRR